MLMFLLSFCCCCCCRWLLPVFVVAVAVAGVGWLLPVFVVAVVVFVAVAAVVAVAVAFAVAVAVRCCCWMNVSPSVQKERFTTFHLVYAKNAVTSSCDHGFMNMLDSSIAATS